MSQDKEFQFWNTITFRLLYKKLLIRIFPDSTKGTEIQIQLVSSCDLIVRYQFLLGKLMQLTNFDFFSRKYDIFCLVTMFIQLSVSHQFALKYFFQGFIFSYNFLIASYRDTFKKYFNTMTTILLIR